MNINLYNKLKISNIRVQCSRGIRLDNFFASSILSSALTQGNTEVVKKQCPIQAEFEDKKTESKPAADMLADWKAQYRSWSWKSKFELGHVMTYLLLFNKFEVLEVLRMQAA